MRSPVRAVRLAVALGLGVLLVLPGVVVAHAALDVPTPADGAILEGSPPVIKGTFTQDMDPETSSLDLRNAAGDVLADGGVAADDPRRMVIEGVPELAPGEYEVRWTTLSTEDGEVERGTWSFTVTAAATAVPTLRQAPTALPSVAPTTARTSDPTPPSSPATSDMPARTDTPTQTPIPSSGGAESASGDVLLPIVAALALVLVAAGLLVTRRGRGAGT